MLKWKLANIKSVVDELESLKKESKITWNTKLYGDGISIALTADLSEAIANNISLFWWKLLSQVTIDELIYVLSIDIKEKEKKRKN